MAAYDTTPLPPQSTPKLLKAYQGAETYKGSQKGTMFRIVDAKGEFEMYPYGHIINCSFRNDLFTIAITSASYIMSGQNLHKIADLIEERKLRALHQHNQERHQNPEKGAIVIEDITKVEDEG